MPGSRRCITRLQNNTSLLKIITLTVTISKIYLLNSTQAIADSSVITSDVIRRSAVLKGECEPPRDEKQLLVPADAPRRRKGCAYTFNTV